MLLVRTTLKESPIHGFGLFAGQTIARGQAVWAFDPGLDRRIALDQIAGYPDHVRDYLEHYCEFFPELGLLVLSGDHDRFTNHADDPNTATEGANAPEARVVAIRDIAEGEEITCDYGVIRSMKWSVPAPALA